MPFPNISARAVRDDGFSDLELDNNGQRQHDQLPNAEEVRFNILPTNKHRRNLILAGITGLVVLLVIILPWSAASRNKNNSSSSSSSMQGASTSSRMTQTVAYLLDYVNHTPLSTIGTPQRRAAEWMADHDPLQYPLERGGRFLQRYALVVFFYSTQGDIMWQHKLNFLSDRDECDWNADFTRDDDVDVTMGVQCNENGSVQELVIRKCPVLLLLHCILC